MHRRNGIHGGGILDCVIECAVARFARLVIVDIVAFATNGMNQLIRINQSHWFSFLPNIRTYRVLWFQECNLIVLVSKSMRRCGLALLDMLDVF